MRRSMKVIVVTLVLLAAGAIALLIMLLRGGPVADRLTGWIGQQVIAIVNTYLVPTISFERVAYTAPGRVDLVNTIFTAPDGTRVVQLEGFTLELAEIPRTNKPIVIERVSIERGTINLIRDPQTGHLRGLWPLVKRAADGIEVRRESPGAGEAEVARFRLSDVLRLRRVVFKDISLRYDPGDGKPPMHLAGFSTELTIAAPSSDASSMAERAPASPETNAAAHAPEDEEAGWYTVAFRFERPGLLSLRVDGRINLDTLVIDVREGALTALLDERTRANLPPDVQQLLVEHEAAGELAVRFSGRVPLQDWAQGRAEAQFTLRALSIAAGDWRLPLKSLKALVRLEHGQVGVDTCEAALLGGELRLAGQLMPAEGALRSQVRWSVNDIDLRSMLRAREAPSQVVSKRPPFAGKLLASGSAVADLKRLPESLRGEGKVSISDGELLWIPGIQQLAEVAEVSLDFASVDFSDQANATFRLGERGIELTHGDLVSTFIAARGGGHIGYDGALDLRVNAGPMEKLKSALGDTGLLSELGFVREIGARLEHLTDRLMSYDVTGTVANPRVRLRVLGR